jgi:hypothetical protein
MQNMKKVLVDDVIDQLNHLNTQKKSDIRQVLDKHTKLFDGTLGVYPDRTFYTLIWYQEQLQNIPDHIPFQ